VMTGALRREFTLGFVKTEMEWKDSHCIAGVWGRDSDTIGGVVILHE
jgi:hypothetical protein